MEESRFVCTGFSYKRNTDSNGYKNCELTDRRFSDVNNAFDVGNAEDWDVFERTRFSGGQCKSSISNAINFEPNEVIERLDCYDLYREGFGLSRRNAVGFFRASDEEECAYECDRHRELNRANACAVFSWSENGDCVLGDGRGLERSLQRDRRARTWQYRGGSGRGCRRRSDTFTVNGKACKRGSQLNTEVRYWYCEVDGEPGWDYCCRPGNDCGYSDGYEYPW